MDPKVAMWINVAAAVLSGLTGGAALFSDLFGQGPAQKIMAGISLAGIVISSINGAMHAVSSAQPGPFGK